MQDRGGRWGSNGERHEHNQHDELGARVVGKQTRVGERDRAGQPPPGVGKTTQVELAYGSGASQSHDADGAVALALAGAHAHLDALAVALDGEDRAAIEREARALQATLTTVQESVTAGNTAAFGGLIELIGKAEPMLKRARHANTANKGVAGASQKLPFFDQIQASFGRHDVSRVRAQVGGEGEAATRELGALAFARGDRVAFAKSPDLHTAAHEAAHVVQQRAGVQLKGIDGGSGDPYERHADTVADAVVAGRSAEALLGQGPSGGGSAAAIQRKTEQEPFVASSGDKGGSFMGATGTTSQQWVLDWGPMLLQKLGEYLAGTRFDLPTTFAVWKTGSSAGFVKGLWAPIASTPKGLVYAKLTRLIEPDPLDPHINAGRDAATEDGEDPFTANTTQPLGNRLWAEPVVAEVGKIVSKRIIESLARIMPRWLAARNQLALSAEGPSKTADRDPKAAEVVPSHPIDAFVIGGLENQLTPYLTTYRTANPDQKTLGDMHLGALNKVHYQWQHDQGAWNWVRVTSPDKATKEDVAFTLYNDATYAHTITDAAPLFGISDVDNLVEPALGEYGKHAATAKQPPKTGDDPRIDAPEQQMQTATVMSDEVMIAQAAKTKPSGIAANEEGRKVILDRMNAGLQLFQMIFKQADKLPRGAYEPLLAQAYARLQKRATKVADKGTSVGLILPWDGQTIAQNDLLTEAFNGISTAGKQYATFSKWPNSANATEHVGGMYLKVACLSEQATAGQEALATANQESKLFPVTVMELLLAEIRKVLHTEGGTKFKQNDSDAAHDTRTDLNGHQVREAKLRAGLARVRDKLLQNQSAELELQALAKELTDLENEVSMVADMDSMAVAWQALYDDISTVGVLTGANSDDVEKVKGKKGHDPKTDPSLSELYADWQRIYARYKKGDKDGALAELKEKRPKWTKLYADIGKLIQHNETKNKWVTFGILVGIAVITAGVGAYVEGAAATAWGASSWATFAVTTGAEATTFTTLSYTLVEKDPTIGGFFIELGKNLVMFGALKGISNKYIQLVGKEAAGTADTMLVQFVSINTASLVEADIKKYAATGQHLTLDQVMDISKQNAIFTIASGLATMAARPGLESLKLAGEADAALARVRVLKRGLRDTAAQLQSSRTSDTRKVGELFAKQEEVLTAEDEALKKLDKIASDPTSAKQAGIDEATAKQIGEDRKAHDETAKAVEFATVIAMTDGAGPVRYVERGAKYDKVVNFWKGQEGTTVTAVKTDDPLGTRANEITTKEGDTFRVIERGAKDAKAVTKSGLELDQSAGKSQADAAEAADLARIRTGEPGKIRSEAELSNADVAKSMNAQLENIKPGEIDSMLGNFPPDQQSHAREVLARASGFGKMEALDSVRDALEPHLKAGRKLLTPGSGSLADNMAYLASKGSFKGSPGDIKTTAKVTDKTVVVLDDVVLGKIKSDPVFAKSLVDNHAVLLEPRGFTDGLNMFNATTPDAIEAKVTKLLARATQIQTASGGKLAFDDAITTALDETTQNALKAANPALAGQLSVVDPAAHPDISSASLANQLNGNAGISEAQVADAMKDLKPGDQALLREMLAHQAEIFSPRRQAEQVADQGSMVVDIAKQKGVPPEKVYYFIFKGEKSYGMVAMAHHEATGTPTDHYINGPTDLASRKLGSDAVLVILDDVAGSGDSLKQATESAKGAGFPGEIIVSPMVSTGAAKNLFMGGPGKPGVVDQGNVTYAPGQMARALKESEWFKSLEKSNQARLLRALNHAGYDANGLSMAFPYMAPDNNNAFFADKMAKDFIVNKNAAASKNLYGPWQPPSDAK